MNETICDLDIVVLTRPLRGWTGHEGDRDFAVGEIGTVVMVHDEGAAFEVEFVDAESGKTTGLLSVEREALRRATPADLRVAA